MSGAKRSRPAAAARVIPTSASHPAPRRTADAAGGAGVATVVCRQLSPVIADFDGNRRMILDAVAESLQSGADVIVLPELSTSGYTLSSVEEARSVAIDRAHPLFDELTALLAESSAVLVFGFCERAGDRVFNSAAVVDASGVRAVYRKTHLWDRETLLFSTGTEPPPVVETAHGMLGVLICYDLEFPEMPRTLALAGADLIAVPTNWPLGEHPPGEKPAEVIFAQAAARANGVFIACCDRAGTERGQRWTEGTAVIDQFGWVVAPVREAVARCDIFPALARDKSISPHNDLLGDRRPELYS